MTLQRHTTSTIDPVVLRDSMSAWARGASCKRICLADLDLDLAARRPSRTGRCAAASKLGASDGVVRDARMGEIDRAERAQPARRHRIGIARGFAEGRHHAAPAQAFQRSLECRLADRIVDHGNAFAAGDLAHALRQNPRACRRSDDRSRARGRSRPSSSLLTVPITVAPRCFAHWHMIRPTPPAAAWIRIVSPGCTLYVSCSRQRAVMPRIIIDGGRALVDLGGQARSTRAAGTMRSSA